MALLDATFREYWKRLVRYLSKFPSLPEEALDIVDLVRNEEVLPLRYQVALKVYEDQLARVRWQ